MEKTRNAQAAEALRRLDEMGAINLGVMVSKTSEIRGAAGVGLDDDDHRICYPFYIRLGPRDEIDIVSVAGQLKELGFELNRVNVAKSKG